MPVPLSHERGPYLELAPNYCIEFLRNSYPIIIVKLAKCLNVFGILTQAVGVHRRSARIKKPIKQYCRMRPLSRPCSPFWGALQAILDFAWGSIFLIEGVFGSKTCLAKVVWSVQ